VFDDICLSFRVTPDKSGNYRMTLLNKRKGGDAYGKVPKRVAIAKRQGEENNAWPGQKFIVFRHCEERSDEAISKMGSLK
jgi:hypothetical protein